MMNPEEPERLKACHDEIAQILYRNSPPESLEDLESIEQHLRQQWLEVMGPDIAFFIKAATGTEKGRERTINSCIGPLKITEDQAKKLKVKKSTRLSPLLEKCSLRMAAVLSFEKAAIEVGVQTGIKIGHSALPRLVTQKEWSETIAELSIKETSVDGGKVRVRGQQGEGSQWLDYKAVRLHSSFYAAYFQENESLINFVNNQPLSPLLTCLGDGHDGIWNLIKKFNPQGRRREILDWFHLMENLHKVGGSNKRLEQGRKLLWEGQVNETIKLFESAGRRQAANLCNYLTTILRTVLYLIECPKPRLAIWWTIISRFK